MKYTLKAKTGKLGAGFQKESFDYVKLLQWLLLVSIIFLIGIVWLNLSNTKTNELNTVFDNCQTMYKSSSLSTEYIPYMQDCMK